ncbi:MAG: secondary thiamine-phosphate synthase enzyme YjbQ [Dehalococcoidia bacterium]
MLHSFTVATKAPQELCDISHQVQGLVADAGISRGLCFIMVPHTTAGITINENADPDVGRDILAHLERMVPPDGDYRHREGNSPAHIKASLMGSQQVVPIDGSRLSLGTWQGIYLCEFDGPRRRTVTVKLLPDAS